MSIPVRLPPNSGVSPSRSGTPVLINTVAMAGGTTASMTTIAAESYKEIRVISRTTGGTLAANPVLMRINGDAGANYDAVQSYVQGSAALAGNAALAATSAMVALSPSAATVPNLAMDITLLPLTASSMARPIKSDFWAQGSVAATFVSGTSKGSWNNTATGITDIQITFGSAATGSVEFWGVPA